MLADQDCWPCMKSVAMLREGMCAHLSRKLVLTAVLDEE